jgi:hypothetical protein
MARIDKTEPNVGSFRAPLHANLSGAAAPIAVGINNSGRVVVGAGQSGIVGLVVSPFDKKAGDIIDVLKLGQLVEFGGTAGTVYTANTTTGVIDDTAKSATQKVVGFTVEADRLIVDIHISEFDLDT